MKKILFSLCAIAAIAACTKSEVQYEPSGEISFAPVAKTLTKSVAGYNGETFDGVFPTNVNLYVFANAQDENQDGTLANTWNSPYFKNALFKHDKDKGTKESQTHPTLGTAPTTGAYAGDPTRYWPNVKTLKFAGYSDACGVVKNAEMDFADNELTIPAYTQDNAAYTAEVENDLMYFLCDGNAYSKQATEIAAQMKHACSWITINVAKHSSLGSIEYKLNKLELAEFYHSGKVVCATTGATWAKENLKDSKTEVYCEVTSNNTITTSFQNFETTKYNFIVIPQTPVDLNVKYTYTSDAANNLTLTETKPVSLKFNGDTAWASGVHYIYNVTITATEILIDPVVVDWTEYDHDTSTTDKKEPIPVPVN